MVKNLPAMQETQVQSLGQADIARRREWLPTPVFLPGESHEKKSLVGYSPWCCKESDRTERLNTAQYIHLWVEPAMVKGMVSSFLPSQISFQNICHTSLHSGIYWHKEAI